jgi:hypothetical protein
VIPLLSQNSRHATPSADKKRRPFRRLFSPVSNLRSLILCCMRKPPRRARGSSAPRLGRTPRGTTFSTTCVGTPVARTARRASRRTTPAGATAPPAPATNRASRKVCPNRRRSRSIRSSRRRRRQWR